MKKPIKVTLIVAVSALVALLVAAILVPFLFKDRIVERLRTELNERIDATVTFSEIDVSLLSTFPTLTARVERLAIAGKGEFEGITLLAADSIEAGVDIVEGEHTWATRARAGDPIYAVIRGIGGSHDECRIAVKCNIVNTACDIVFGIGRAHGDRHRGHERARRKGVVGEQPAAQRAGGDRDDHVVDGHPRTTLDAPEAFEIE